MKTIKEKIYDYFTNNPQLRVLFVFDGLGLLQKDIDEDPTEWPDGYVYCPFAGDWFTTKIRLTKEWADKKVVLLFDGKVGEPNRTDQEACRAFPLMSVMEANMVFREEDEAAFMDQHQIPSEYADFVRRHINELQRDKFDNLLAPHYGRPTFSFDLAHRAMISAYMDSSQLLEWYQIIARLIIQTVNAPTRVDAFFSRLSNRNNKISAQDIGEALNAKLMELSGKQVNFNSELKMQAVAESLKYNAITQKLGVDANDPYKDLKLNSLAQTQAISSLLGAINDNSRLQAQFATAFESLTSNIREDTLISVYGPDADYSYWSEAMCRPIVAHVVSSSLQSNPNYVIERLTAIKQYVSEGSLLLKKIEFSLIVARYYERRNAVGSLRLNTPDLYVAQYTSALYGLDLYYRQAIAAYTELGMDERTPKLEEIKTMLNQNYAAISNEMNLEWVRCLEEFGCGLRSLTDIQRQQDFYSNLIKGHKNKVVVIVSDALRYELAAELIQLLQGKKHMASLMPALAMLPTETKYCKPALLPHNNLHFDDNDLKVDGKVLTATSDRTNQLSSYEKEALCINYKDLYKLDKRTDRREIFKHPLVYVFHNTIDDIGHDNSAKTFSSACKDALDDLKQLVLYLHDFANVTDVFITADHGFLYNDQVFEEKDKQKVEEEFLESKTRYYITASDVKKQGIAKFALPTVSGMEEDLYVAVPLGTNRLAAPAGGYEFAHGGASLQELVIPIIYSKYKEKNKKEKVNVELLESTLHIVSSRLKVHLVQKEAVDMEHMERKVVCGLYRDNVPVCDTCERKLNFTDADPRMRTVELDFTLSLSDSGSILQFKVFDENDLHNPLISTNVINNTLIEQDDF